METILKEAILRHLQTMASLSHTQHGFILRRSCLTNLLLAEEEITHVMDAGEEVDSIFLDFAKAFGSVNQRMLCDKMLSYGIHESAVDWTRTFSTNRTFRIRVEQHL